MNLKPSTGSVAGLRPPGRKARRDKPAAGLRQQGQPLFQRARDEENVARVRVNVPHELLDALAGRAFGVAQVVRDGGLEVLGQHVHRPVDVIMHLRADAQQEIVGRFKLLALAVR